MKKQFQSVNQPNFFMIAKTIQFIWIASASGFMLGKNLTKEPISNRFMGKVITPTWSS